MVTGSAVTPARKMLAENSRSGSSLGRRSSQAASSASWPSRITPSRICIPVWTALVPTAATTQSGSNLGRPRCASSPSATCFSLSRCRGATSICWPPRSASTSHTAPASSSAEIPVRSQAIESAGRCFRFARWLTSSSRRSFSPLKVHSPLARARTGTGSCARVSTSSAAAVLGIAREYTPRAMQLIDIGANLTHPAFQDDVAEVVARARNSGVSSIVVTGTSVTESEAALRLSKDHSNLYVTAGVHPHHARECDERTIPRLREIARDPRVVAIGECGLDFNRNYSPHPDQEKWFLAQVDLAIELKKPLFMHSRDAFPRFSDLLKGKQNLPPPVAPCFHG